MSGRLDALAQRALFTVLAVTYSWADVLLAAETRGSLGELRDASRRGLALAGRDDDIDEGAVRGAAERFRYARGLLSAEELDAWLARWELTVAEWGEYLERNLLLEWAEEEERDEPENARPDAEELDDVLFVDAVCSGFLEREAERFAGDAALAGLGADELTGERAALVEQIIEAADAARVEATSAADVEREIAKRGLDWTRLELDALDLDELEAAREAALCVRVDGRAIADVAADCGTSVRRMVVYVGDVAPQLQPSLLAAQPGELIGPVEDDDAFVLFALHERTPPGPDDPELKRRATSVLVERALSRAMQGVDWHDHL